MTIKAVAITNSTGEVFQMWMPGSQDYPSEGAWSEDNSCTVHHVDDQNDHATFMATRYWKDGAWQAREANTKPYYVWKDYKWELDSDALWVEIRQQRDNLLAQSDWTQLSDCKLTNVQINDSISINAAIYNLTNQRYYNFQDVRGRLATVPNITKYSYPERNLQLGIKFNF